MQRADGQRPHVDRRHEVGRAEDDGLQPGRGGGDGVHIDQSLRRLDLRLDPDPTERQAQGRLQLPQRQVEPGHVVGRLHLGQHHAVQVGPGALHHVDHIAVRPRRGRVVDPYHAGLGLPATLGQRGHDVGAGLGLGQRSDRVLEIEEHLVGR
jgi:hypothetical protein